MHPRHLPRTLARSAPFAAALLASAALAAPAGAAVADPNGALVVGLNTSDILLGPSEAANVTVERDGTLIASGTTAGPAGGGESGLNAAHLPGATGCWDVFTPQFLAGDLVTNVDNGDTTVVAGVSAEPKQIVGNTITLHGTAADASGARLPADEIDAQLHPANGRFQDAGSSGKQFMSASTGDAGGSISYDADGSTRWTARFTGLSPTDFEIAKSADVVAVWNIIEVPGANGFESTEFTVGATPANPDCTASPYAPNEPQSASHSPINSGNVGTDLVITGKADPNVTAAVLTLKDSAGHTVTANGTLAAGTPKTLTATVPAGSAGSLADGTITVTSQFTNGDGSFHGGQMTLLKDTTAPAAVTASVAPGTYQSAQSIALSAAEGTIRYTTNGEAPTALSPAYAGPINVANTQTIKAIAIDSAGNASPVAQFDYAISPPVVVTPPVIVQPQLPKLKVEALTLSRSVRLRSARRSGVTAVVYAPAGAKIVRIRILRGKRVIQTITRKIARDAVLQLRIPTTRKTRRALRKGLYTVQIQVGQDAAHLGSVLTRHFRIR